MIFHFDNIPGAKYGIYGSFLPAHRRSPVGSQSRSPPRVQNHITPQSPNTLQTEVFFIFYDLSFANFLVETSLICVKGIEFLFICLQVSKPDIMVILGNFLFVRLILSLGWSP